MLIRDTLVGFAAALLSTMYSSGASAAEDYPSKPITIVIASAPGAVNVKLV